MGRYIGPKSKIARKFGEAIFGADRVLEKRNFPPGQHGLARKRKKVSEYGQQLSEKQKAKAWDDPIFDLSHQFAEADEVVIGAPYWDLSFPAALKVYMEHVSVCDIAFHYTEDARCEGICKADRLTYIASCGGFVEGANFGYEYFCGIAKMFGIPETRFVAAEGLDIVGIDVEAQMDKARAQIAALD